MQQKINENNRFSDRKTAIIYKWLL